MIVIELTQGGEKEGRKKETRSKFGFVQDLKCYGPGESHILSTDIDLDTWFGFPGICALNILVAHMR